MSITIAPAMQVLCKVPSNRLRAEGLAARIAAALDRMTETLRTRPTSISWQDDEAPRQQPYFGAFHC